MGLRRRRGRQRPFPGIGTEASEVFERLMGGKAETRRDFIPENALDVANLDA